MSSTIIEIKKDSKFNIKIEDYKEFDNSLFKNSYELAKKSFDEIITNVKTYYENKSNQTKEFFSFELELFEEEKKYNNIIAFTGERGTGKTSVMFSFAKALREKGYTNKDIYFETIFVDPTIFDDSENILEVFVSKIFSKYKKVIENQNLKEQYEEKKLLLDLFQKVYRNIKTVEQNDKFVHRDEVIEQISNLSSSTNLKEHLNNLVMRFLNFMINANNNNIDDFQDSKKFILLLLDDFDLNIKHVNEMSEYIRKYLNIPNIIILTALNFDELIALLEDDYIKVFDKSLTYDLIDKKTLKEKVVRYTEKIIPYSRRMNLLTVRDNRQSILLDLETSIEKEFFLIELENKLLFLLEDYCLKNPSIFKDLDSLKTNLIINKKILLDKILNKFEEFSNLNKFENSSSLNDFRKNYNSIISVSFKEYLNDFFLSFFTKDILDNRNNNENISVTTPNKLIEYFIEETYKSINVNIEFKLINLIYLKTGLKFRYFNSDFDTLVPDSLRSLKDLIFMLYNLKNVNVEENRRIIRENIKLFEEYFDNIWIKKNFSIKNLDIIKTFNSLSFYDMNSYIIENLLKKFPTNIDLENNYIDTSLINLLNICEKLQKNSETISLTFAVKTKYSFLINQFLVTKEYSFISLLVGNYNGNLIKNPINIKSFSFKINPIKSFDRMKVFYELFFYDENSYTQKQTKSVTNLINKIKLTKEYFTQKLIENCIENEIKEDNSTSDIKKYIYNQYSNYIKNEYTIENLNKLSELIIGLKKDLDLKDNLRRKILLLEFFSKVITEDTTILIQEKSYNIFLKSLKNILDVVFISYEKEKNNFNYSNIYNFPTDESLFFIKDNLNTLINTEEIKLELNNKIDQNNLIKKDEITRNYCIEVLEFIFIYFRYITKDEAYYSSYRYKFNSFDQLIKSFESNYKALESFFKFNNKEFYTWDILNLEYYTYFYYNEEKTIKNNINSEDWNTNNNSISIKLENWFNKGYNSAIPIYDIPALEKILLSNEIIRICNEKNNSSFYSFIYNFYNLLRSKIIDLKEGLYLRAFEENPLIRPFVHEETKESLKYQLYRSIFSFVFSQDIEIVEENENE